MQMICVCVCVHMYVHLCLWVCMCVDPLVFHVCLWVCVSSSLLFIHCSSQDSPFCVVCWPPAVMKWCQGMQLCAWATALSWRELLATCWAPILCCYCCTTLRGMPRGLLCKRVPLLLWGSFADLNPGAIPPHNLWVTCCSLHSRI